MEKFKWLLHLSQRVEQSFDISQRLPPSTYDGHLLQRYTKVIYIFAAKCIIAAI